MGGGRTPWVPAWLALQHAVTVASSSTGGAAACNAAAPAEAHISHPFVHAHVPSLGHHVALRRINAGAINLQSLQLRHQLA